VRCTFSTSVSNLHLFTSASFFSRPTEAALQRACSSWLRREDIGSAAAAGLPTSAETCGGRELHCEQLTVSVTVAFATVCSPGGEPWNAARC
jgi:hypothetical protein